jgi:hypothetical protein
MSSRGKKKTTMAKLSRESRLRERRLDKQARKDARKAAGPVDPSTEFSEGTEFSDGAEFSDGDGDSGDEAGRPSRFTPVGETAAQAGP